MLCRPFKLLITSWLIAAALPARLAASRVPSQSLAQTAVEIAEPDQYLAEWYPGPRTCTSRTGPDRYRCCRARAMQPAADAPTRSVAASCQSQPERPGA